MKQKSIKSVSTIETKKEPNKLVINNVKQTLKFELRSKKKNE